MSLDPPWRVFLRLQRAAGKSGEKQLSSGVLPLFVIRSPMPESSRSRPAIKSFGNELLLLLFTCCVKGQAMVGRTWKVTPLPGTASEPPEPPCPRCPGAPRGRQTPASPATAPPGHGSEQAARLPGQLFPALHFENWGGGSGGVGEKFVFNYLTGVGQTLLCFPLFLFFFPKQEKELGKGRWTEGGGRGLSGAQAAALMKPALEGPFRKRPPSPPPAPPPQAECWSFNDILGR